MDGKTGRVYLVGAGCGGADWITVRGLRLLERCDAVVYDDLIDNELLEAVPAGARKIYMGKRLGRHSAPQEDISRVLISLAQGGSRVVRLKGGDPFVFGRGGEEIQALQAAGVPFEVVPGISSAIAIPGQAGIPVTHRGVSRGFHVVTAHTAQGSWGELERLAGEKDTLVILMGLSRVSEIAEGLVAAGRDPDTPAAVVSGGCAPRPTVVRAPLGELPQAVREAKVLPPAVIVVGETAGLDMTCSQSRPLEGRRVALTGTAAVQKRLRRVLEELGARPFSLMAVETKPCPAAFDWTALSREPGWVVLTSQNGVEHFFHGLERAEMDLRGLASCRFAVIGPATGAALRRHGILADLCPAVHTTRGLADALEQAAAPGESVRLFRSALGSRELSGRLEKRFRVEDVPLYTLQPEAADRETLNRRLEEADYLFFSSASGVDFLMDTGVTLPETLTCVCIGPVTARALSARGVVSFLAAPDISAQGLAEAAATHAVRTGEG